MKKKIQWSLRDRHTGELLLKEKRTEPPIAIKKFVGFDPPMEVGYWMKEDDDIPIRMNKIIYDVIRLYSYKYDEKRGIGVAFYV